MELSGKTVLISGGSSGIGLGLAEAFHGLGSQVIVTGRNEAALQAVCQQHPGMAYYVSDISSTDSVRSLAQQVSQDHPGLDWLINNAGIQRQFDYSGDQPPALEDLNEEIATNLNGLIWMSAAFLPLLKARPQATIVNVSSGLGYVPIARLPVYCATKAAVNSFSLSLRHQLRDTGVRVINLAPPAVETPLDQGRRGENGPPVMSVAEFTRAAMAALATDEEDIAIGLADQLRQAARSDPKGAFARMNG